MKRTHTVLLSIVVLFCSLFVVMLSERWLPAPRAAERRNTVEERTISVASNTQTGKQVQLRSSMALRGAHGDPDPSQQQYFPVDQSGPKSLNGEPLMPTEIEGTENPMMLDPREVNIPEDAAIIGIEVAGEQRAYLVEAVALVQDHILNQLIGGVAVSVTYCNQTDCVRVFTSAKHDSPIDLRVGGLVKSGDNPKLVLMLGKERYQQDSASLPLQDYRFERMSWATWLMRHPQTSIFVGEMRRFLR